MVISWTIHHLETSDENSLRALYKGTRGSDKRTPKTLPSYLGEVVGSVRPEKEDRGVTK